MSDGVVHDPRAASLALLDGLIRRGRKLAGQVTRTDRRGGPMCPPHQDAAAAGADTRVGPYGHAQDPAAEMRIWQADCAAAINELSGGSKAHWLSRAYSNALLVRSTDGEAVVEADAGEIVRRVLDVLEQGRQSLIGMNTAEPYSADAQEPHRFDFVHDPDLRPVLERTFVESRSALERGQYEAALKTTCGILEAIITDALKVRLPASARPLASFGEATPERAPASIAREGGKPDATTDSHATVSEGVASESVRGVRLQPDLLALSFDERITAAEAAGLIRGGCARLPAAARAYRDADQPAAISEREATVTRQVLRVVMRDLDPGR